MNAPFSSSSTPHFTDIAALADAVKALVLQKSSPPAFMKAVEEICVTCGGPHPYHQCLVTDGNIFLEYRDNIQGYVSAAAVNYNQGNTGYRPLRGCSGFEVNLNHMFVSPEPNMVRSWVERCDLHVRKAKELRDRKTHIDLDKDLV
ncbi:hypothetical protein Tco_0850251 [Tanacetum coccineum]